ncbi:MAG: DegT/DnrJ/EryC1/StrS family aminotransferase [Candidatus Omnitrophota bacterium]|nr:DegT/DnrJ/EryC1/StrS family aminotransferase [Candidatus Omnitrophota bacterium]
MPIPLLNLTRQTENLRPELERAARDVLRRGEFILGSQVALFEKEFARSCSARFGIGVASGTDALELALRALGVGAGDWVAVPSMTFLATADAVLHVRARPLFVDIDPLTYTMDPLDLDRRARSLGASGRKRLKAVVPVHLYGHPCDMDAIGVVARRHKLVVVEDAAQAAGARWKGRPVGGLGSAGCFSFFPTKNLGAFGDAGMVVTSSAKLDRRLRSLRVHGRGAGDLQAELGRNSRLDELQAALLRVKLKRLGAWVERRRKLAAEYTRRLLSLSGLVCPVEMPGARHAFHLYVIRSPRREVIRRALEREGIAARVYYPVPLHKQPLHRSANRGVRLPETEKACKEVLALPLFPELTMNELRRVCSAVTSA